MPLISGVLMRLVAALSLSLVCSLTGCALTSTSSPTPQSGYALQGNVHGGQQPIAGAHVYLLAANTTGYGGNGIAASALNASVSLLKNVAGSTTLDASGGPTNGDYYVTTAADGSFSITNDYTCTQNTQVYLYALGGNPGSGANSAAGLLAALGNCPAAQNFAAATPFVWVNEVSTIAAAYAFAGFATDATHVSSSGTPLAQTGIANAFANAANLASLSTGVALTTTPAGDGTVPQTEINTLANILAACVNSAGPGSGTCSTLFANAMSSGTSGTTATDTASAAINIAHNPANVSALYAIPAPTIAFAPALATQPNDFTIGLQFTGGGLYFPSSVAIDASGNAWITNQVGGGSVTKLSPSGAILSGTGGFTGGGLSASISIAIDTAGNAWIGNLSQVVTKLSPSGSSLFGAGGETLYGLSESGGVSIGGSGNAWISGRLSKNVFQLSALGTNISPPALGIYNGGYEGGGLYVPTGIAIDGSGNAWVANSDGNVVTEISSSGSFPSGAGGYAGGGLASPVAVAIDSAGNAWFANSTSSVTEISNSGAFLTGTAGITGGGLQQPLAVAIDGSGNAWFANLHGVTEVSSSGVFLSGSTGYTVQNLYGPKGIAVDGSGNVWLANNGIFSATELIGAAIPVITPIAAGLPVLPTLNGSSNLGTRP